MVLIDLYLYKIFSDDPTLLDLDEDDLLFDDYEYVDDFDDEDYEEIIYEYEYEDGDSPEVIIEYEYVDEEEPSPPPPPPPKPKYKPRYKPKPNYSPSYSYHTNKNLHGHKIPNYNRDSYRYEHEKRPHYYKSYSPRAKHTHTGPQFLREVSGLLERAENSPPHITLSGSLRSALLRDVDSHVQRELNSGPGGRINTQVYRYIDC